MQLHTEPSPRVVANLLTFAAVNFSSMHSKHHMSNDGSNQVRERRMQSHAPSGIQTLQVAQRTHTSVIGSNGLEAARVGPLVFYQGGPTHRVVAAQRTGWWQNHWLEAESPLVEAEVWGLSQLCLRTNLGCQLKRGMTFA